MIHLNIGLGYLPVEFSVVRSGYSALSKNKTFEWQINRTPMMLGLCIDWHIRQSHAGVRFDLTVMSWEIMFSICDNRHWNLTAGRWMTEDEMKREFEGG